MTIAALVFAALSLVLFVIALSALRRRAWLGTTLGLLTALLALSLAALTATLGVAIQGYRALTREEVAATVALQPLGEQRFRATFRFADGRDAAFDLAGDGIYVEAHIVKWHPAVNFLGLHTAYELDRIAGRYDRIEDEQRKPRTIVPISQPKPVDLFLLARSLRFLAPLVDAEYGSATFTSGLQPAALEVRVSTSGLLLRPASEPAGALRREPR